MNFYQSSYIQEFFEKLIFWATDIKLKNKRTDQISSQGIFYIGLVKFSYSEVGSLILISREKRALDDQKAKLDKYADFMNLLEANLEEQFNRQYWKNEKFNQPEPHYV